MFSEGNQLFGGVYKLQTHNVPMETASSILDITVL